MRRSTVEFVSTFSITVLRFLSKSTKTIGQLFCRRPQSGEKIVPCQLANWKRLPDPEVWSIIAMVTARNRRWREKC
jgi:hypothetical protein